MSRSSAPEAELERWLQGREFGVCVEPGGVVRAWGELDCSSAPVLAAALTPLMDAGADVVIDLTELNFLGVAGINVFVAAARDLGERGRIVVRNAPQSIARVFELTERQWLVDTASR